MGAYTGGCTCGAARYEIGTEPIRGFYCQCRDCQRNTGAGHSAVAVFPSAALKVTGSVTEHLRTADSGVQKRKGFCAICGSPLYNQPQNVPDMIGVYVGTLDDPSSFKPQVVMFAARGHDWDLLDPALPKFPNMRPS
jgi:hypothetical protein